MRILHATIHKSWLDMIVLGVKKEEYREIKPYWTARLEGGKKYDAVCYRNGYSLTSPMAVLELMKISTGMGRPEWGAPLYPVYILHLGEVLSASDEYKR